MTCVLQGLVLYSHAGSELSEDHFFNSTCSLGFVCVAVVIAGGDKPSFPPKSNAVGGVDGLLHKLSKLTV